MLEPILYSDVCSKPHVVIHYKLQAKYSVVFFLISLAFGFLQKEIPKSTHKSVHLGG